MTMILRFLLFLLFAWCCPFGVAAPVTLDWDPPTDAERAGLDVAGYRVMLKGAGGETLAGATDGATLTWTGDFTKGEYAAYVVSVTSAGVPFAPTNTVTFRIVRVALQSSPNLSDWKTESGAWHETLEGKAQFFRVIFD